MSRITVVGSTTWGTTLALLLARLDRPVWLLARTPTEAAQLYDARQHTRVLPGHAFPPALAITASAEDCLPESRVVFVVVPAQSMRTTVRALRPWLHPNAILVSAAKGLELESAKRMTEVMAEELPEAEPARILALSGPNLAKEVAAGLPGSTVVGGPPAAGEVIQGLLMSRVFRVYTNPDLVGVEMGGALKNIIALGAGISDGLGFGDNAKAGLITRGLAEITRLSVALGARRVTMMGLSGLGDLVATCSSTLSRNHYVGEQLAHGRSLAEIQSGMQNVAEGVTTSFAARGLALRRGVEMPITEQMCRVLAAELEPARAVLELMQREPKREFSDP